MSCEKNSAKVCQTAAQVGVSKSGAKSSFVAGSTSQISFFTPEVALKNGKSQRKKSRQVPQSGKPPHKSPTGTSKKLTQASGKLAKNRKGSQKLFFDLNQEKKPIAAPARQKENLVKKEEGQKLPTHLQVEVSQGFTPEELQIISIQLRLGGAAASRHLREVGASIKRGIGHGDPRPQDWIEADHKNFGFLVQQLNEARRGQGYLDLSSLDKHRLLDLWEFCRFETDRANRNIDHLNVPGGGISGPTADYLINNHKLEARFFSHIAANIERIVPSEDLDGNTGYLGKGDE